MTETGFDPEWIRKQRSESKVSRSTVRRASPGRARASNAKFSRAARALRYMTGVPVQSTLLWHRTAAFAAGRALHNPWRSCSPTWPRAPPFYEPQEQEAAVPNRGNREAAGRSLRFEEAARADRQDEWHLQLCAFAPHCRRHNHLWCAAAAVAAAGRGSQSDSADRRKRPHAGGHSRLALARRSRVQRMTRSRHRSPRQRTAR